jgi:orotate phosphoribosyltransferase
MTSPGSPPDDLVRRLLDVSELHGDFVLSSGRRSNVYFDKFRFLADPALLREVAERVRALLPEGVTHLAAPEGAATLLLSAVALKAGLPMIVVRKEPKAYGTRSRVEGYPDPGAVVALIEDVSTTGHQVEAAAKAVERQGCTVACIVLALDRGGAEVLRASGYRVETVVSVSVPPADAAGTSGAAGAGSSDTSGAAGAAGAPGAANPPGPAG